MQRDLRIDLKNTWIAGGLAYLIPGAGHCYQGRYFKAILYFVCITGTFLMGLSMGDWKIVYTDNKPSFRNLGYFAQAMVGGMALPAILQSKRYENPDNVHIETLHEPMTVPYQGFLKIYQEDGVKVIDGNLKLIPIDDANRFTVQGEFTGVDRQNKTVKFSWQEGSLKYLDQPISADPRRPISVNIQSSSDIPGGADLDGTMPRPWYNWVEVPLDNNQIDRLHGDLGKFYEFAVLYTWIAGLLNVLAIWDAIDGPAYGYGDEEGDETNQQDEQKTTSATESTAGAEPVASDNKPAAPVASS